jgi:hypothetical protein
MTYHWQASLGAIIVTTLISASRTGAMANYDIDNLPATDRLAAASLEVVISAWVFESVCGLPSAEDDYALSMRYVQSSDFKRRDQRLSKVIGNVTNPAAKVTTDHSACVSEQEVMERGANRGRYFLNYFNDPFSRRKSGD